MPVNAASRCTARLTRIARVVIGVPMLKEERDSLSAFYLERKIQTLKRAHSDIQDDELQHTAKQLIIDDLDQFLHQIAARSQTLLAVIALVIGIFVAISKRTLVADRPHLVGSNFSPIQTSAGMIVTLHHDTF
jgi:hypothetical protein